MVTTNRTLYPCYTPLSSGLASPPNFYSELMSQMVVNVASTLSITLIPRHLKAFTYWPDSPMSLKKRTGPARSRPRTSTASSGA
jgi:hypothetical protein